MDQQLYINGRWVDGAERLDVCNPFNGERCGSVAVASIDQVDEAARAAHAAAPAMAAMPLHKRADILHGVVAALRAQREEIGRCIATESGKALRFALVEVDRACDTFTLAAEEARRIHGETVPMDAVASGDGFFGYWQRRPVGVVGAITPFNFPLNLVAHKVAPAIAAGNAVVLKPAEVTPLTAGLLGRILDGLELPPGAFNIVHGSGETVGDAIVRHPLIPKLSFTGSPRVGALILAHAGIKKVTLELGNNAPVIVAADADLEAVAAKCAIGANYNSGQVCISTQRIYVEASVAEAFTTALIAATEALQVGNQLDAACDVGPLITAASAERVEAWVNEAVAQGARIRCGGSRSGQVYQPTVLDQVTPDMQVMAKEVFAPVASVIPCPSFDDALRQADDTAYGLQAAVFTNQLDRAFQAIEQLHFGGVVINDMPHTRPDHIPYGGNRMSGLGREGLRFAIEEMTTMQMVMIRHPHARQEQA